MKDSITIIELLLSRLLVNKPRYAGDGKKVDCFFPEIPYSKITPDKYPVLKFSITP